MTLSHSDSLYPLLSHSDSFSPLVELEKSIFYSVEASRLDLLNLFLKSASLELLTKIFFEKKLSNWLQSLKWDDNRINTAPLLAVFALRYKELLLYGDPELTNKPQNIPGINELFALIFHFFDQDALVKLVGHKEEKVVNTSEQKRGNSNEHKPQNSNVNVQPLIANLALQTAILWNDFESVQALLLLNPKMKVKLKELNYCFDGVFKIVCQPQIYSRQFIRSRLSIAIQIHDVVLPYCTEVKNEDLDSIHHRMYCDTKPIMQFLRKFVHYLQQLPQYKCCFFPVLNQPDIAQLENKLLQILDHFQYLEKVYLFSELFKEMMDVILKFRQTLIEKNNIFLLQKLNTLLNVSKDTPNAAIGAHDFHRMITHQEVPLNNPNAPPSYSLTASY